MMTCVPLLRRIEEIDIVSAHALLSANGWASRIGSTAEFSALIAASQVADIALIRNDVVGFVRAITDGQSNGYLSMLAVHEAYRGQGVGRALVRRAIGTNPRITWVLRAGRDGASEFFSKLGFARSEIAMERRRE